MSKKGLSAEEKRVRLLELFKETKEFYKLQDLEKLAPKAKGITAMSVKDVLQELVNDNLVKFDKIGIMNFYWCFPSDIGQSLINREEVIKGSVEGLKKERDALAAEVQAEEREREETEERLELLAQLEELRRKLGELEAEDAKYVSCDPRLFKAKELLVKKLEKVALNWTDNVCAALCHIRDTHGEQARDQFKEQLGITEDFEDLSFP